MKWYLPDCRIVGSVCSLHSSAPFARDAVVLAHGAQPDARMILGREQPDGSVEGERMTEAEWQELLACNEALALTAPVAAGHNAKCWLLRASFPERERAAQELRARADAIVHEESLDGVLVFVVDESRGADLLERWSRDAFDRAGQAGQRGEWDRAFEQANLAWLTDGSPGLDRVALLALATEQTQGASAAEDIIAFELNSRASRPEQELRSLTTCAECARFFIEFEREAGYEPGRIVVSEPLYTGEPGRTTTWSERGVLHVHPSDYEAALRAIAEASLQDEETP